MKFSHPVQLYLGIGLEKISQNETTLIIFHQSEDGFCKKRVALPLWNKKSCTAAASNTKINVACLRFSELGLLDFKLFACSQGSSFFNH
jgi:hypothetical protein